MSSPPPPYTLQPPPAYACSRSRSRKLPACPPRQSSRQLLTRALQRARHAVQLDSSGTDIPSAVAAYGEAIEVLQHVIVRRSRTPGNEAEVERVMNIHDRYLDRVRNLCRARRLPLPSHIADTPSASGRPHRGPSPGAPLAHKPSTVSMYQESECGSELTSLLLSTSSPSSVAGEVLSKAPSVDSSLDRHDWSLSEAGDEEVTEWGKYLDVGEEVRRVSVGTAASVWSTIAVSHG